MTTDKNADNALGWESFNNDRHLWVEVLTVICQVIGYEDRLQNGLDCVGSQGR